VKSDNLLRLTSLCHIAFKGRGVQSTERAYAVLQIPAVRPRLGELQATPLVCGVVTATCTRSAWRRGRLHQHRHAATAGWRKGINPTLQLPGLQARSGGDAQKVVPENTEDYNGKGVFYKTRHSRCVLRGGAQRQDKGSAAASGTSGTSRSCCHNGTKGPLHPHSRKISSRQVSQFGLHL
jgi:hypothetical protein